MTIRIGRRLARIGLLTACALGALTVGAGLASAGRAVTPTQWGNSSDPYAIYGICGTTDFGSAIRSRTYAVYEAGETLANVLAVTLLECRGFTGMGPVKKTPCPPGSPYAYCMFADNEGMGNWVKFGVLKTGTTTAPNQNYTGCPTGVTPHSRLNLLLKAGKDPRLISGIVTLSCGPATGPTGVQVVPCPAGPNPYAYCLGTQNDGGGTAAKVGVVAANGPGDPYGLYGECSEAFTGNGSGFRRKSTIAEAVGLSLADVSAIYLMTCTANRPPAGMTEVPCSTPGFGHAGIKFDHCILGRDSSNNWVRAGVVMR